jgi:hypothetical protein
VENKKIGKYLLTVACVLLLGVCLFACVGGRGIAPVVPKGINVNIPKGEFFYEFTPKETGIYICNWKNVLSDAWVDFSIGDNAGSKIRYISENKIGQSRFIVARMEAGKTYYIRSFNESGGWKLNIQLLNDVAKTLGVGQTVSVLEGNWEWYKFAPSENAVSFIEGGFSITICGAVAIHSADGALIRYLYEGESAQVFEGGSTYYLFMNAFWAGVKFETKAFEAFSKTLAILPENGAKLNWGQTAWFKFVPNETAIYYAHDTALNPCVFVVYDENFKKLDTMGNGASMYLPFLLQEGKTYYFNATPIINIYSGETVLTVNKLNFTSIAANVPTQISVGINWLKFIPQETANYHCLRFEERLDSPFAHVFNAELQEIGGLSYSQPVRMEQGSVYYLRIYSGFWFLGEFDFTLQRHN